MRYNRKTACANCPFRKDKDGAPHPVRLRHGRVLEIHNAVTDWNGGAFACHKTTKLNDDGESMAPAKEQHCAGAIAYAFKLKRDGAQIVRFGMHVEGTKREDYGPAEDIFESLREFEESAEDYAGGIDPCHIVDPGCEAPAGYMTGSGIAEGTESAEFECEECGQPTCGSCMTRPGICNNCADFLDQLEITLGVRKKKFPRSLDDLG